MTDHRATFNKAAKQFKSGVTAIKNQMHIMLIAATEHRVASMQSGKGGDASLLTQAFYMAREAKVVRANDIIPYLEKYAGVKFDDSDKRKTDTFKLGQFVPVNGADISTVKMNEEPWHEFMKPEPAPKPLDLVARLTQLAKEINKHKENPVEGDVMPEELSAFILEYAEVATMARA